MKRFKNLVRITGHSVIRSNHKYPKFRKQSQTYSLCLALLKRKKSSFADAL